jgi:hypothetical protein
MCSFSSSTFSREPAKNAERSWIAVGWMSSIGVRPLEAIPPACSIRKPMGEHSYSRRSLPCGFFGSLISAGYMKMPPYSSVRWMSATIDPM